MKESKRYIILEEPTLQEVVYDSKRKFCPFAPNHLCKGLDCMMFVSISIRDTIEPDGVAYEGTPYGRCGLMNIPSKARMFEDLDDSYEKFTTYFVGDYDPDAQ